jgi:hypothetical protein
MAEQPAQMHGGDEAEETALRLALALPDQQHRDVAEADEMLRGRQGEVGLEERVGLERPASEVAPMRLDRGAGGERPALEPHRAAARPGRRDRREAGAAGGCFERDEVRHGAALSRSRSASARFRAGMAPQRRRRGVVSGMHQEAGQPARMLRRDGGDDGSAPAPAPAGRGRPSRGGRPSPPPDP